MDILQTKLTPPPVRADRVHRPRLIQQFSPHLQHPLTLVCAPAGYGKSSLLGEWLSSETGSARQVSWFSLDEDDNDPVRFLTYLISAISNTSSIDAAEILSMLHSPQPPPPKAVFTALIRRLESSPLDLALVLDDYHLITAQPIHDAMIYLLDHLPTRISLVIISREDPPFPLARYRGRGQLTEIRADDLRFTSEEAGQFLEQMLGIKLKADQISELDARTEGWIGGLQLAALAMRGRENIAAFISAFTGSHRFILDYLTEEVLSRQSENVRDFLLQTSVLNRLSAPLCDAVTGRSDGHVMLRQIEHGNLFLIPLDDERFWYRYHHLFGDMLRRHLQQTNPGLAAELHHRASIWFEQNDRVPEALEHALLSQNTEQAARLVQKTVEEIALSGQAQTILRWMNTLPDAVVRSHPRLCVYHAAVLMFTYQLDAAELWLKAAEKAVSSDSESEEGRAILGWVALLRADIARVLGDLGSGVAFAHEALALLPPFEPLARGVALMNVAHSYLADGNASPSVEQIAEEATTSLHKIGNLFATMISMTNVARLQMIQGRLTKAQNTFARAEHIAPGGVHVDELLNGAAFHIGLGSALLERNDLQAADKHLVLGIDLVKGALSVDAHVITAGYVALAKVKHVQGDTAGALALLDEFAHLARQRKFFEPLIAQGEAARVPLWLAQGDFAAVDRWVTQSGLIADDTDLPYVRETEYLTLAYVLIMQKKTGEALHLLNRLQQDAESSSRMRTVLGILGWRALAWQVRGDLAQSLGALTRALALAEPEGYVRIFLDKGAPMVSLLREAQERNIAPEYVRKLLAAFAQEAQAASPPARPSADDLEPLSEREQEVLRMIADGASNREIAQTLVVSIGTVKKHLGNIFLKLDAHSRTQAIANARQHKLL